jgi:hypothetical protein
MATELHAGKRRHVTMAFLDKDGAPRAIDGMPTVSSSNDAVMMVQLNMDPADGGAADGSVVDVIHNALAPGSGDVDCDLMASADAQLDAGVTNISGTLTVTCHAEDVPAPAMAETISFGSVGEEIDKKAP